MSVSRGDVVLLNLPFITRPGSKIRPVLIVQNDRNNARMANTIVAMITTNTGRSAEPTQVLIDPALPEGNLSGLIALSVVSCENLLTVRQNQIIKQIGHLSDAQMQSVELALKASLALS